jgi:branched-subunit amino acid transport protein
MTELPGPLRSALRMIPPSALAALVAPALLRPAGTIDLAQPYLLAGAIAAVVAWTTRSVLGTIVVGMVAVVALRELGLS